MDTKTFAIVIPAPVDLVWDTLFTEPWYGEWTGTFKEGSAFAGSWEEGELIRFVGPDEGGFEGDTESGLLARVAENRPNDYLGLEYIGLVVNGVDDTTSDQARAFAGGRETYSLSPDGDGTALTVEMETLPDVAEEMAAVWPSALEAIRAIAVRRLAAS